MNLILLAVAGLVAWWILKSPATATNATVRPGEKVKGADGLEYVLITPAGQTDANGNQSIAIWGRADGSPGQYLASLEPPGVPPFFTLLQ